MGGDYGIHLFPKYMNYDLYNKPQKGLHHNSLKGILI